LKEERVNQSRVVVVGAVVGAVIGAAATYLFYTDGGKHMRERLEPAVDDLRREFARFQKTIEKLGEMANDGMRVVNEFNQARAQSSYSGSGTSH
jgi:gas vesicle protein